MNATVGKGREASAANTLSAAARVAKVIRSVISPTQGCNPAQKPAGFAERTTSAVRNGLASIAQSAESSSARRGALSALTGAPGNPSQSVPIPYSATTRTCGDSNSMPEWWRTQDAESR